MLDDLIAPLSAYEGNRIPTKNFWNRWLVARGPCHQPGPGGPEVYRWLVGCNWGQGRRSCW